MNSTLIFMSLIGLMAASAVATVFALRIRPVVGVDLSGNKEVIGFKIAELLRADSSKLNKELGIVGKSFERFVYERLVFGIVACLIGVAFFSTMLGSPLVTLVATPLYFYVGWILPKATLKDKAQEGRFAMRQAVTVYEELGAAAIAGGSEINAALRNASSFGDGPEWARLRLAVRRAQTSETTFSAEISRLAELYDLSELESLANLVAVSEQGGLAQASLEQMSLQQTKVAAQDAADRAERNTSSLVLAIGLLFASFALFMLFAVFDSLSKIDI